MFLLHLNFHNDDRKAFLPYTLSWLLSKIFYLFLQMKYKSHTIQVFDVSDYVIALQQNDVTTFIRLWGEVAVETGIM